MIQASESHSNEASLSLENSPINIHSRSPENEESCIYDTETIQTNKKHTVVVLIDDPEQQRQMMLEQEQEDCQKLELLHQQQQETTSYQNLTTMTVLSLGSCY